jgi:hypothetical protein
MHVMVAFEALLIQVQPNLILWLKGHEGYLFVMALLGMILGCFEC